MIYSRDKKKFTSFPQRFQCMRYSQLWCRQIQKYSINFPIQLRHKTILAHVSVINLWFQTQKKSIKIITTMEIICKKNAKAPFGPTVTHSPRPCFWNSSRAMSQRCSWKSNVCKCPVVLTARKKACDNEPLPVPDSTTILPGFTSSCIRIILISGV